MEVHLTTPQRIYTLRYHTPELTHGKFRRQDCVSVKITNMRSQLEGSHSINVENGFGAHCKAQFRG